MYCAAQDTAKFDVTRTTEIEKPHLASGVTPSTINRVRQVRCGPWHDLARDWHLWSSAERAAAVFLLFALTIMPGFFLTAWLCLR